MSIESELYGLGGLAKNAALHRLGLSVHDIRIAVASGRVFRPRRGWVALRDADPQLIFAAQHNLVLTCITQAKRLGLWVLEHNRMHVAGSLSARQTTAQGCTVHWRKPIVLRAPGRLIDGIENVLDAVAACQPHDAALAIWDSALQKKLTDYQALASLPLGKKATQLLKECSPFADSGLESMFRTRLRWTGLPIHPQAWVLGHRVDFLIGERLIVQIDGRQHTGTQRVTDMEHDAELALRGYTVIRVSYSQIIYQWENVEHLILDAVARGLHHAAR